MSTTDLFYHHNSLTIGGDGAEYYVINPKSQIGIIKVVWIVKLAVSGSGDPRVKNTFFYCCVKCSVGI